MAIAWLRVTMLAVVLSAPADAGAQDAAFRLTFDPAMVKGPVSAPVTIVEFSDYQ